MADFDSTHGATPIAEVVSYLRCSADTFGQLAAIFRTIESREGEYSDLRKLAGVGHYLAEDFANLADGWREEVEKGGIRCA